MSQQVPGQTVATVLKRWIDMLYPSCTISRADRLERKIQSIALVVHGRKCQNVPEYL